MNEVLITGIFSLVTGVGTWFAARRKNLADAQASELDVVEKSVRYYREIADDLAKRLKESINENDRTNQLHRLAIDELTNVKIELKNLEVRFNQLADENRNLVNELKKYKQLNGKEKN
ncbi:hypothetical protein QP519_11075 [Weeksella virosa]|uniref:hypothetical protein n=1 Tax=Weeksella virosa TaxID=1014 RepID=UPI00255301A5|nr:hypothetical protein [Weeksella virosa]MDK7376073.1 hypothetical protein [Weeksella virosa]